MAMVGKDLGDAIWTAVMGATGQPDNPKAKATWEAIGTAITTYLAANAKVSAGVPVSTTGSASAQTGATTAPGSIT